MEAFSSGEPLSTVGNSRPLGIRLDDPMIHDQEFLDLGSSGHSGSGLLSRVLGSEDCYDVEGWLPG